jgi:hypothetical protein
LLPGSASNSIYPFLKENVMAKGARKAEKKAERKKERKMEMRKEERKK